MAQNSDKIDIKINGQTFSATLESNSSASSFFALLPLTLQMTELNGNEKYNYLNPTLPTNTISPGTINAGDIMLYSDNCIVVFYKTFNTSYSYSRIGHIDDTTGLANAVGSGNVTIEFTLPITTSVPDLKVNNTPSFTIYDMNGRLISHDEESLSMLKGIFIINGKKTILK